MDAGDANNAHSINFLDFDAADPASVFDDLYSFFDAWYHLREAGGPMFELHLRMALRLLLHDPAERHALPSLVRLFTDKDFREVLVMVCEDDEAKQFWEEAERHTGESSISNLGH